MMGEHIYHFWPSGRMGDLYRANQSGWLEKMNGENPALFDYFRYRETAKKALVAWFGEFPGKLLTCVAECYQMTGDPRLLTCGSDIAAQLRQVQAADGYLGPYQQDQRLTGFTLDHPGEWPLWDVWGHYHCIYGLCLWYEAAGDCRDLAAAERAAGCVMDYFGQPGRRYVDAGRPDQNLGISHGYWKLFRLTGKECYRREANRIMEEEWKDESVGDWRTAALEGKEYYEMLLPRWESLHSVLSLRERAEIEENAEDREAFCRIWASIRKTDRHNDGGFSSGEGACGNPYDPRAIETCCTVLWMVLTVEYLQQTLDSLAADEWELSLYNAYAGALLEHGTAFTYNTPMDGRRFPARYELSWQSPPGTPALNCCQANGARGFGQWGKAALITTQKGIYCNEYGPFHASLSLPDGTHMHICQSEEYPLSDTAHITLNLERPREFSLFLRIPAWSAQTQVWVNEEAQAKPAPGQYFELHRQWNSGDRITVQLDLSAHFWVGERECLGKVSVYCGPVLLAADSVLSGISWPEDAVFSQDSLEQLRLKKDLNGGFLYADVRLSDGTPARLVEFAEAGRRGQAYVSWLRTSAPPTVASVSERTPWCAR